MAKEPTFQELNLALADLDELPTSSIFTVDSKGTWTETYFPHHETFTSNGQLTDKETKKLNKLYAHVEKNMLSDPLMNDTGSGADLLRVWSNTNTGLNVLIDDGFETSYYNYDPKVLDPLKDYLISLDAKYGFPLFI